MKNINFITPGYAEGVLGFISIFSVCWCVEDLAKIQIGKEKTLKNYVFRICQTFSRCDFIA